MKLPTLFFALLFFSCQPGTRTSDDPFVKALTKRKLENSDFFISLPPDYAVSEKRGPDFSVYYFEPNKKDPKAFIAGLYFGNHPSEFAATDSCKTEVLAGKILGDATDWSVSECDGKITIQTIVENGLEKGWNRQIHAFGNTTNREDLQKILAIYSTLEEE